MTTPAAVKARTATLLVFGANGFAFASWMSRVPDIRRHFELSPGQLSLLLLAISIGSLVGLPLAGRILERVGTTRGSRLGIASAVIGLVGAAVMVAVAPSFGWVAPFLLLFGFGNGTWDVAQNLEGTSVERAVGRAIMPWFHAAFSGGTVLGALVGAAGIALGVPVGVHIIVASLLAGSVAWVAGSGFLTGAVARESADASGIEGAVGGVPAAASSRTTSAWLEPRTLLVGVMVMAAAFTEGTANDWMAVAFVDGHHVSSGMGVLGVAVFLSAMTLARLLGTSVLDRHGRVPVLIGLFSAAIVGCLLVVFGNLAVALVGAAIWGVGAGLGFPVGMSAASDDPRRAAARLSVVSTLGYTAFLGGPVLLGFLGDHFGALRALLAVGVAALVAIAAVPLSRPQRVDDADGLATSETQADGEDRELAGSACR